MKTPPYTHWFLFAWIAVAILWDIFAIYRWGIDASICKVLREWANFCPPLLIALGALLWHIFHPGEE